VTSSALREAIGIPRPSEERPYDVERARKVIADANEQWLAERERAGAS